MLSCEIQRITTLFEALLFLWVYQVTQIYFNESNNLLCVCLRNHASSSKSEVQVVGDDIWQNFLDCVKINPECYISMEIALTYHSC